MAETPEEAPVAYIGECDCDRSRVEWLRGRYEGNVAVVRIRHEGLMDDSLKNQEYLVVVDRVEDRWRVRSASYFIECQRSISANGLWT